MDVRLIVIRTGDAKKLADFYSLLGFTFEYHKHGSSPYHYSATIGRTILEIYPLAKTQSEADKYLRLGFEVDGFEDRILAFKVNEIEHTEPIQTDFGFLSIITDPDGRKVEVYKK